MNALTQIASNFRSNSKRLVHYNKRYKHPIEIIPLSGDRDLMIQKIRREDLKDPSYSPANIIIIMQAYYARQWYKALLTSEEEPKQSKTLRPFNEVNMNYKVGDLQADKVTLHFSASSHIIRGRSANKLSVKFTIPAKNKPNHVIDGDTAELLYSKVIDALHALEKDARYLYRSDDEAPKKGTKIEGSREIKSSFVVSNHLYQQEVSIIYFHNETAKGGIRATLDLSDLKKIRDITKQAEQKFEWIDDHIHYFVRMSRQ